MKMISYLSVIVVVITFWLPYAHGTESYDNALSETAVFILKELKFNKKLHNRRIAVYGFRDETSGLGCKALTASLANKMVSIIHNIKTFTDADFSIVARRDLDVIETEHLISKGGSERGDSTVWSLLEPSDILITGVWQNGESVFVLTVKALEIRKKGTRIITSRQVTIDKFGLPGNLLDCLPPKEAETEQSESESRSPAIRALQEEISRQDKLVEELRKQRQSKKREVEMMAVIEKRKKIIAKLMQKPGKGFAYTTRRYDENFAFVNIDTNPDSLDVYIDGVWVGKSPLKLYEIEAGKVHTITAKGDPRYFAPEQIERKYDRFDRMQEKLILQRGNGKILLLGKELFDTVKVDGNSIQFDPNHPVIVVPAGRRRVEVFESERDKMPASFVQDVWSGDVIRRDVAPDERFVRRGSLVVLDGLTGLEWVAGPDKDMSLDEAESWVRELNVDGGGWRMPTIDQLKGLYLKGKGNRNMTPFLKTTGWRVWSGESCLHWWPWSGETKDFWFFDFDYGHRFLTTCGHSNNYRAFAVRSRDAVKSVKSGVGP